MEWQNGGKTGREGSREAAPPGDRVEPAGMTCTGSYHLNGEPPHLLSLLGFATAKEVHPFIKNSAPILGAAVPVV